MGVGGAIYRGFFWEDPLWSLSRKPALRRLTKRSADELRASIDPYLSVLSPCGWYPGIPNRTLLLNDAGLRIVYHGSMGDEIGLRSLEGCSTIGFFRSRHVLEELLGKEHFWTRPWIGPDV